MDKKKDRKQKKKRFFAGKLPISVIRTELEQLGIDLSAILDEEGVKKAKAFCIATDLSGSLKEIKNTSRDQVVMVRVDEKTRQQLDAWVETGAIKSRSEAAALFIREGLKLREADLNKLAKELKGVEDAKKKLHEEAALIFGTPDKK